MYSSVSCIQPMFRFSRGTGRRLLEPPGRRSVPGNHRDAGVERVDLFIQVAQEGSSVDVLVAPLRVGHPFAGLARIVEIEHRGDRVDAQAIDVIAVEPEEGARNQVVRDLAPSEVEDRGIPVGMEALSGVGVLIERVPSNAPDCGVDRKCAGTQSAARPAGTWQRSTKRAKRVDRHSGMSANSPTGWWPHDASSGCSVTGMSSRWVNPISTAYGTSASASSSKGETRAATAPRPRCTS